MNTPQRDHFVDAAFTALYEAQQRQRRAVERDILILGSTPRSEARRIALDHGVKMEEVCGPHRHAAVVAARHEIILTLHDRFNLTPSQIGRIVGKDHTSVLYVLGKHGRRQVRMRQVRALKGRGNE